MSRAKVVPEETAAEPRTAPETAGDSPEAETGRSAPAESAAGATEPAAAEGSSAAAVEPPAAGDYDETEHAAAERASDSATAEREAGPATTEPIEIAATDPAGAGVDQPTVAGTTEAEPEPAEGEVPGKTRPAWLRLPALLLAAALVLAGAGAWFTLEARSTSADPAAGNLALTDVGATADVTSAITLAMNRIFSYSYDKTDVTEKAAAAVLRGDAKTSYDKLFAQVRQKAPEQKLVLTSRVSAIAVQELRNGHARLLVFLDQSAVRADNNATDSAAAQLSVTAEHTGDGWVVTALEPR